MRPRDRTSDASVANVGSPAASRTPPCRIGVPRNRPIFRRDRSRSAILSRAPFQVLVLPYRQTGPGTFEFAVFSRSDEPYWQGIAGGGEDNETPLDAARREAFEEAGIAPESRFLPLDTTASISVRWFRDSHLWGDDLFVIPEYAFGAEWQGGALVPSHEHTAIRWLPFASAYELLRYDSNRTALWELNQRICGLGPRDQPS